MFTFPFRKEGLGRNQMDKLVNTANVQNLRKSLLTSVLTASWHIVISSKDLEEQEGLGG